jgi:hypothetical protein
MQPIDASSYPAPSEERATSSRFGQTLHPEVHDGRRRSDASSASNKGFRSRLLQMFRPGDKNDGASVHSTSSSSAAIEPTLIGTTRSSIETRNMRPVRPALSRSGTVDRPGIDWKAPYPELRKMLLAQPAESIVWDGSGENARIELADAPGGTVRAAVLTPSQIFGLAPDAEVLSIGGATSIALPARLLSSAIGDVKDTEAALLIGDGRHARSRILGERAQRINARLAESGSKQASEINAYAMIDDVTYYFTSLGHFGDLGTALKPFLQVPERFRRAVARQAVEGLNEIEKCGVYPIDIKPANIVVNREGKLRFIDLGAAFIRSGNGELERPTIPDVPADSSNGEMYTEGYRDHRFETGPRVKAQEILTEADASDADKFALGMTLFELSRGSLPDAIESERLPKADQGTFDGSFLVQIALMLMREGGRPSYDEILAMPYFKADTPSNAELADFIKKHGHDQRNARASVA